MDAGMIESARRDFPGPVKETVCAVFVTYRPDPGFPDRASLVAGQVGGVLVIDNRSDPETVLALQAACARPGFELIRNAENLGVAAALNLGARRAGERGFRWILAMDQDSTAEPFLLDALLDAFEGCPWKEKVAVVGSNYLDERRGKPFVKHDGKGPAWIEQCAVITSGSLLSLGAFERIGPFREEFFIDHVDDEYCLRALSKGFKVILCRRPAIRHPIGAATARHVMGKPVWTSGHSAVRRYYMIRNFAVLAREYFFSHPGWILWRSFRHAAFVLVALLLEPDREEKARWIARGLKDGLSGRTGRIPG